MLEYLLAVTVNVFEHGHREAELVSAIRQALDQVFRGTIVNSRRFSSFRMVPTKQFQCLIVNLEGVQVPIAGRVEIRQVSSDVAAEFENSRFIRENRRDEFDEKPTASMRVLFLSQVYLWIVLAVGIAPIRLDSIRAGVSVPRQLRADL